MNIYDLCIIGAGPAGEVGAIRAAQLGMRVALVDRRADLGGTCLNVGCIPTKALLESAKTWTKLQQIEKLGFMADKISMDWHKVLDRKQNIVNSQRKGLQSLMKKNKVTVLQGTARFVTPTQISIQDGRDQGTIVEATKTLVATGSRVSDFPLAKENARTVFTSDSILNIGSLPPSISIIGGGVIGVEFASMFSQFGSKVTIFEMAEQIIPMEDPECAAELARCLKKNKVSIHVSVKVKKIEEKTSSVRVHLESGDPVEADVLLLSTGRSPVTRGLGLEQIGVQVNDHGYVVVDQGYQSSRPEIFAVGDCIQTPALAHTASSEAKWVVEVIAGMARKPINYRWNPSAIYSSPEVASLGAKEAELQSSGVSFRIAKFPFAPMAKAKIEGGTEGFIKILFHEETHELLGVHIVGAKATELISEFALGAHLETTLDEIGHTIHPHPTIAETIMEAAHMVDGPAIHM